jgi:hypothetical protein
LNEPYQANPKSKTVPPTRNGLIGSSHETVDTKLLDPPIRPSTGTMQQSDALADVIIVNNTEAFITFLILCYY